MELSVEDWPPDHWPSRKFELTHPPSASLVAQLVKNPPAVQEIRVQSLGREDPLEKGMATHPSILSWRISPWGR